MIVTMAEVFEQPYKLLEAPYLQRLLARPDFWAVAAFDGDEIVGGLTAYTLAMTRSETAELFIYDIAVRVDRQRQGIGRALMEGLLSMAEREGIKVTFVPAENEDTHALDFYHALGGDAAAVTIFTYTR